jgi:hypothetical protein
MGDFWLVFGISFFGLFFLVYNALRSVSFRKKIDLKSFNFFSGYLVTMAIIEIGCHFLGVLEPGSNFFISHFQFNFQFIIITLFFLQLFKGNGKIRSVLAVFSSIVLLLILMSYVIKPSLFWEFNLFEIGITSLTILVYVIFYFYTTFDKVRVDYHYFFGGLSIYLLSSSLIFLTGNVEWVLWDKPFIDIWVFNSLFYILFQFFVMKELQFLKKKYLIKKALV